MITKLLVSGAIVLGAAVGLAAPAIADPSDPAYPVDSIGSLAMNCGNLTDCAPSGPGTTPTVDLNDVVVAFKGSASDLSGF